MATKKDLKDTKFIADLFDLSERRIQQLSSEKDDFGNIILPSIKQGKNNVYDLIPTVKTYVSHLKDVLNGKALKQGNLSKETERLDADIRYKNVKAETAELLLKETLGKMHRSEDVESITTDLVLTIRGMLVAIPNRCADELASMEDSNEISNYLNKEINQVLEQLSQHEYDSGVYSQKVRERNKKDLLSYDEDE